MLTIVSYPKPFVDKHISTIQTNAICSWKRIAGDVQILLVGSAHGVSEVAEQHGVEVLDLRDGQQGDVVLFGTLLSEIAKKAKFETLCFVNCDIILPTTFAKSVVEASKATGMLLGTRTDYDLRKLLEFSSETWESQLHQQVLASGSPMRAGADWFVFRIGYFGSPPPIYVGRPGIDNWIIWYGRQKGMVCDLTPSVLAVHQNHRAAGEWGTIQKQEESIHNCRIIGEWRLSYGPADATHEFRNGVIVSRRWQALSNRVRMGRSIMHRKLRGIARGAVQWFGFKRPTAKVIAANGPNNGDRG